MTWLDNPPFRQFEQLVRAINWLFANLASLGLVALVGVVMVSIIGRATGVSFLWPSDVAQLLLTYIVFLSLAPALQSGHHVGVELFEPLVPRFAKPWLDHVAALACIVFGAIFLKVLWSVTAASFADNRLAMAAIDIRLKWVQLAGPLGLFQFVLTALVNLLAAQRAMTQRRLAGITLAEIR